MNEPFLFEKTKTTFLAVSRSYSPSILHCTVYCTSKGKTRDTTTPEQI